ncbi:DUF383 domain-containing protein [Balamuthia mandrillaris]
MAEQTEALKELVDFLADPKPEVRIIAIQHLVGYTGTPETRAQLKSTAIVRNLLRLTGDISAVATKAFSCLINLSQDKEMASEMLKRNVFARLVDGITDPENKLAELHAMLMTNLTRSEEGCKSLLQVGEEALEGYYFSKVIQALLSSSSPASSATTTTTKNEKEEQTDKSKPAKDPFCWLGTVLMNVSQLPSGRKALLEEDAYLLKQILPFVRHPNLIRRRGILGTIRNCCFEPEQHSLLLEEDKGVNLLLHVLPPLVGPEQPFDEEEKKGMPAELARLAGLPTQRREEDLQCKKLLLGTLLLLCHSLEGRTIMRAKQVYPIIRHMDMAESVEEIHDIVSDIVNFLMRDEATDEEEQKQQPKIEVIREGEEEEGNKDDSTLHQQ